MKIETFALERWMTTYETRVQFDIAESGICPLTASDLLQWEPPEQRAHVRVSRCLADIRRPVAVKMRRKLHECLVKYAKLDADIANLPGVC
jgi:hypothetical protein